MLTETILLDIASAERQINQLEAELRRLSKPVEIPVDIQTGDLSGVRRELGQADQSVSSLNSELEETTRELRRVDDAAGRAGRELDDTGRRGVSAFGNLGVAVAGFGAALAAAQGLRTFVAFAGQAIDKASDLAESVSKAEIVFGDLSGQVKEFAATGPQALGLSTQAALEATATFGNLFVALGLGQQAAAELSPDIVQLAADLSAFNNIEVGDVIEKLRSGLVGEAEPLRVLGVNLTEATVKAKALELGLVGTTGELSEAAKVQARWALILEQTTTAQGNFALTSDEVAGTQRKLTAAWEDAQAAIGNALLPAYQDLLATLPGLIDQLVELGPAIGVVTSFALDSIGPLTDMATLFGNIVTPIAGLVAGLGDLPTGGGFFEGIGQGIKDSLNPVGQFNKAIEDINARLSGIDPVRFADAIDAITTGVEKGREPLTLMNEAISQLGDSSNITAELLNGITSAAGGSNQEIATFVAGLLNSRDKLKLTSAEVKVLRDALLGVSSAADFMRGERDLGFTNIELPGEDPAAATNIDRTTAALARMDSELAGILGVTQNVTPTVGLEDFLAGFDAVKESMDSARAALHDDQGAIITDLDTFFDNLNAKFAEQLEFARGIATLRSRGQDQLADFFAEQGADALGALQEAIADPAKANEIERTFVQQQEDLAAAGFTAFDSKLKQLILGIEPPEVVIPLTFGGLPDIPISALTAGQVGIGGVVTVNIVNPTTQDVTTDAARAGQIIGSVSNRTGGAVRGTG